MGAGGFLAAITVGQAPRVDITADILPLMPPGLELREYGALDDFSREEILARFAPEPGDEVLVSRMRDGSQVKFAERFVTPLVQEKITRAEEEGAQAIVLFCTGAFPHFDHRVLLLKPQELFHAVAARLADGKRVGLLVPEADQVEQVRERWNRSGLDVEVTHASPYGDFEQVRRAGAFFRDRDVAFVCTDCMGYSMAMKRAVEEASGHRVILPRTLVMRVLGELFA